MRIWLSIWYNFSLFLLWLVWILKNVSLLQTLMIIPQIFRIRVNRIEGRAKRKERRALWPYFNPECTLPTARFFTDASVIWIYLNQYLLYFLLKVEDLGFSPFHKIVKTDTEIERILSKRSDSKEASAGYIKLIE